MDCWKKSEKSKGLERSLKMAIPKEVYEALEKEMDKDQILELYLYCIYLSQGCSGVQTAARQYFDKDAAAL